MAGDAIAVLYSGGTDSTLAAALSAERFRRVHLLTYDRFGLFSTGNAAKAAAQLAERFGPERVTHAILPVERLFRHLCYERYPAMLRRHGFFLLSVCGLCKLAMHARTVVYCLDSGIAAACDGANQGMRLFPAQMAPVLAQLRAFYARFGIRYENPVFDYDAPEEGGFLKKENLAMIRPFADAPALGPPARGERGTTGRRLWELGLAPAENIKGTPYDRGRQPRCFQFVLFNIFARKYYLAGHSEEEYRAATVALARDKLAMLGDLVEAYRRGGAGAELLKG